eukprot:PLAT1849.3.p1 GENE.PLAT1849.3~~PLAT1849.3.p1  ORF type:complete len:356 (-),score=166.70 PLAT1849.3:77-1144(-)
MAIGTAMLLGTACAAGGLIISLHSIAQHVRHFTQPKLQLYICRILLMVPIYSFTAWLSLLAPEKALLFDTVRDCYEAFVIYTFFQLLLCYLGGEAFLADVLELKAPMRHPPPLQCLSRIPLGARFLRRARQGILQFVLVKPLTAAIALLLHAYGKYGEGSSSLRLGFVYLSVINNVSVSMALYYLVLFYMATETRLEAFRPLPKFLCIKAVVFFSYWQSILLLVLDRLGLLHQLVSVAHVRDESLSAFLQDLFICAEMLLAAIAHSWAFPPDEFQDDSRSSKPLLATLKQVLSVDDTLADAHSSFLHRRPEPRELDGGRAGGGSDEDEDGEEVEVVTMLQMSPRKSERAALLASS